jgi:deaminated glutathione amidase
MRAAIIQTCTGIDPANNLATMAQAIAKAKAEGADMAFLPEMCGLLDRDRARSALHISAEESDPVLAGLRIVAAEHQLWLHVGSIALSGPNGLERRNRGFVIDDSGNIRARYDKIHLFDVALPTGETWRESDVYGAGHEAVAVDTPWGIIGLSICYDLRFPALYQSLSAAGAVILSIPAAFTRPTGAEHWEALLRARAIENATFVIAAAQCGTHEDGRLTYGHSLVIDPWGTVLHDSGEKPGVALVDLDLSAVPQVRSRIPVLDHRRVIGEANLA